MGCVGLRVRVPPPRKLGLKLNKLIKIRDEKEHPRERKIDTLFHGTFLVTSRTLARRNSQRRIRAKPCSTYNTNNWIFQILPDIRTIRENRQKRLVTKAYKYAGVAESVDAPGLGPGGALNPVEVRVLSPAYLL